MNGSLRRPFVGFRLLRSYLILACVPLSLLVDSCLLGKEKQSAASSSTGQDLLKGFLQNYLGARSNEDQTTRYVDAFTDLNGDGIKEAIVYVTGRPWCGSGGCVTLVLTPEGSSYRVVTKISITRPPIRVLDHVSNGWRHIGVLVQGGGIQRGYEAELLFDGNTYPANPSAPPARRLNRKVPGQVIVASARGGKLLYP